MNLFESVQGLISNLSGDKKDSLFDDVNVLISALPGDKENSPIDQMRAEATRTSKKNIADQFDQMAKEELNLPPEQRNTAINSPAMDVATGGMSLPQADANARAQLANIRNIPKALMGTGRFVKDTLGHDLAGAGDFLNDPVKALSAPTSAVPPRGTEDIANVGGNALNFLFGPAIKSARAIGGLAIPENGKTPLESMVKDVVADPGIGVYSSRIGDKVFTGQETPEERTAKVAMVGAVGTLAELATFDPKTILKSLGNPSKYKLDIQKQVLDSIKDDLPAIKDHVATIRPDLSKDVIDNLTPEHVVVGAQTNPTLGEYLKIKEQEIVAGGKKNLYTAQPDELPKPEDIAKLGAPENVIKPLAAVPQQQTPEDLWDNPKPEENAPLEPTNIQDKAEMEISALSEGNVHPLEKAMEGYKIKPYKDGHETEEYKEIPQRFRSSSLDKGMTVDDARSELEGSTGVKFNSDSEFIAALKSLGNKQMKFGLSDDVQSFLKIKENVDKIGKKLDRKLGSGQVKKIINSYTGVKKPKTDILIQTTEQQVLKHMLKVKEKASNVGFKAGQEEGRGRAIAELKNLFENQTEAMHREAELQQIKDDIIARDKSGAKYATYKNRAEAKLDVAKREAELQRLQDDIIARDKIKVKKELISYIKESLPVEDQGKYLNAIGTVETASQASHVFRRIWHETLINQRKDLVTRLKSMSKDIQDSGMVAVEYKEMIKDIIDGIEFKTRRPGTLDKITETLKHIERKRALGEDVEMPDYVMKELDILKRKPINQFSVAELTNLVNNLEDFVKIGKTKLKTRESIYALQKDRIKSELVSGTVPIDKQKLFHPLPGEKLSIKDKFMNLFPKIANIAQHIDVSLTFMDTWFDLLDGGAAKFDGPNYRNFKKRLDTKYQSYLKLSGRTIDAVIKSANDLGLDDSNFERIGVYAASVQKGGRQKLLDTGLTDKFIDSVKLTENELKFYKVMRKALDELRPLIADTMKNVFNEPLGKVENYFSFLTDFEKMSEAEIQSRFGEQTEFGRLTKEVRKGFTKERVGGYQPIKINAMDVFIKHVDNAAYLIHMSRDVRMLSEIANSPEYGKAAGELGQSITKEWLDLMARKGGKQGDIRIKILDLLRKNFGIAQLGFNVTSALIQPTALLDGAAVIGHHAFDGLIEITHNPQARNFVMDNMPELKARIGDDPAFREFGTKMFEKIQKAGYIPLKFLDGWTATGVAWGAYVKKMAELGLPIDYDNPNAEAISYAQLLVRDTQSSGEFKDLPLSVSKGKLTGNISFDKALLQFQSFMLKRWDILDKKMVRAYLFGGRGDVKQRNFTGAALILSMVSLALLAETEARRGIKKATNKIMNKFDARENSFNEDFQQNVLQAIPIVSQALSIAVYKNDLVPSFSGIHDIAQGVSSLGGKKEETKLRGAINIGAGVGQALGIPGTAQVSKILRSDVNSNPKKVAVDLYEKALRDPGQYDKLFGEAKQIAVENRVLLQDVQKSAHERIHKEIIDLFEQEITTGKKSFGDKAENIGEAAGYDQGDLDKLWDSAKRRQNKSAEKNDLIEEQSRTYKPRPGLFDETKKLMDSFK